jgi:arginyl-tRNA synthetase
VDGYQGLYIEELAAQIRAQVGTALLQLPREEAERRCQTLAYERLLNEIRADLARFGVTFQSWFSEASLQQSGAVLRVINELKTRGLIVEQDGAVWFRASAYGDEKDRVVQKQGGEFTYLASDIAYHRDKLLRGYDRLINIWGADHHGYIPRMQAVMEAFGYPRTHLGVVLVQMVNLLRGGKKVEMSKRAGEFITLREVIDEVSADAAKFSFLMRRSDTHLDFDLELVKQQSADNPVYYVQYAHARVASLCRVAESRGIMVPNPSQADLSALTDPDEFALIRKLALYPTIVEGAVLAMEPHRIAVYLQELAGQLHAFYFRHRILPPVADTESDQDATGFGVESKIGGTGTEAATLSSCHRESLTPTLTGARLALMQQVRQVIHNGLGLLGVSAPERM